MDIYFPYERSRQADNMISVSWRVSGDTPLKIQVLKNRSAHSRQKEILDKTYDYFKS